MINLKQKKIILLVGMMGCGKTSLGKILSRKLGLPFIDSDKEIKKPRVAAFPTCLPPRAKPSFAKAKSALWNACLKMKCLAFYPRAGARFYR